MVVIPKDAMLSRNALELTGVADIKYLLYKMEAGAPLVPLLSTPTTNTVYQKLVKTTGKEGLGLTKFTPLEVCF